LLFSAGIKFQGDVEEMVAQIDLDYFKMSPFATARRLISYLLFEGRPLTTRGRWINPLVFTLFRLEKACQQVKRVDKPVFILGTGRSGTTILGTVLSMHREVGFLNEPKALWHAIHPEEDLIGSYARGAARYRLDKEDATSDVIKHAHRLFGAYLAATFAGRVVDKYPELIFRIPFVKSIFPEAKFLFLVRNGWDTCRSIDNWSKRLGTSDGVETHDWWGVNRRKWNFLLDQIVVEHADLAVHINEMRNWTSHVDMAAVEWIVTMREGLRIQQLYPDDVLRVTYEELCTQPQAVLTGICKFVDLPVDDERFFSYAKQTLQPTGKQRQFPLNPAIEAAFMLTMKDLGYS
jgi:hypothetical protein